MDGMGYRKIACFSQLEALEVEKMEASVISSSVSQVPSFDFNFNVKQKSPVARVIFGRFVVFKA